MRLKLFALACCICLSAFVSAQEGNAAEKYDPAPNPAAVVRAGHARFTVLFPQMVRMEWAADDKFEDRASFVFLQRDLPAPKFLQKKLGRDGVEIKTADLTLRYEPEGDGRFDAKNLSVMLTVAGKPVTWHPGNADNGNLMGTTRTLDGAQGGKTKEPIGQGLISRDGWVVVDDSTRPVFDSADFSFPQGENSAWPWVASRPDGERQDWYFLGYGRDYKQALMDYVKVAGRIPLPPRFAFGAWWSRYWAYSDQELDDLVKGFRENSTPLDVFVIDMDWHKTFHQTWFSHEMDQSGHTLGWSGYSWNRDLFPDPEAFLKGLHDDGLKVTLNLHPASGVQPHEDAYADMARAMGQDPAEKKYVPFDITNKQFAENYFKYLHHPLEREGVDFWWLDWQQEGNTRMSGVNPTWWLNYVHFSDQEREGKRPLLFHRWGGLGNHRYQIGFSGDTISVWESLAFQPGFTAQAANVGYAYWSHDIGGHMPGAVDPELYLRWLQFGEYSPILRTHTTKNPESERRIWAYPEPFAGLMRDVFQHRYAIEPYVYTEARRTYDTGVAFLRPLYYDWPNAPESYDHNGEYIFGESLLAAPVVAAADEKSQLAQQTVWLPPGEWFETSTGRMIKGGQTIAANFTYSEVPVYAHAGAIVPEQPPMDYTGQKPVDPLILDIAPRRSNGESSYSVYEDSSEGRAYEAGQFARTNVMSTQKGSTLTVHVDAAKGSYPGMLTQRAYELQLPGDWPPTRVTANGTALNFNLRVLKDGAATGWAYDGNTLTTIVRTPRYSTAEAVDIVVTRDTKLAARRAELNGFAGATARLRKAYDALNQTWPLGASVDSLTQAWQTGDRMMYRPETAGEEMAQFHARLAKAEADVNDAAKPADEEMQRKIAQQMNADWKSDVAQKKIAQVQMYRDRAAANVHAAVAEAVQP